MGKLILVMPRRMSLGEQRNDHQLATVEQLSGQGRIAAAMDEVELIDKLDNLDHFLSALPISNSAHPDLLMAIRRFVEGPVEMGVTDEMLETAAAATAGAAAAGALVADRVVE